MVLVKDIVGVIPFELEGQIAKYHNIGKDDYIEYEGNLYVYIKENWDRLCDRQVLMVGIVNGAYTIEYDNEIEEGNDYE